MSINRIREYGGYLPFEYYISRKKENYFDSKNQKISKLNCGRSCFYVAARSTKIKKVYIPYFTCIETAQPFEDLGIPITYYSLDPNFFPKNVELLKDEYLLWTNYYGNASKKMISLVQDKYRGQLIIDNCHAFFCPPIKEAFNCYSARKFIGVADGAYLVTDLSQNHNIEGLERDTTFAYMSHLFQQNEKGTNDGYVSSLQNEKRLEKNYALMSITTEKILNMVDFEKIKKIRKNNFLLLHAYLEKLNDFPVNPEVMTQMYYPFKCKDRTLRENLIKEKIYSPTWWRHVVDLLGEDSFEAELALDTVLLPIDQRYSPKDMKLISQFIHKLINI